MSVARSVALLCGLLPVPASADIAVLKCNFPDVQGLYFTIYDDGTPARIGNGPGVGDRGLVFHDPRTRAMVIIEKNKDDIPITFTTIYPDMDALHSRALIGTDGRVLSPSQGVGRCQRMPLG